MKITGFITEYNPLHNGHLYHILKSREMTGADYTIALMSGSHVQRGEPAVFDKYVRTQMALQAGVDLVLEMPAAFSTASAMEFASYGIALFTALGTVDTVVFGSECGSIKPLQAAADLLSEETPAYRERLQALLKEGKTYPTARAEALGDASLQPLLLSPNNILGIEYLRAANRLHSPLHFETIARQGSGYHETLIPENRDFSSASALRQALKEQPAVNPADMASFRSQIPVACLEVLSGEVPVFADDYSLLLTEKILSGSLEDISDLTPEISARLKRNIPAPLSFSDRIRELKTRQLTYTRVSRALLHLVLGIRDSQIREWKALGYAPYARILGFRRDSSPLLKKLKETSAIPLISRVPEATKLLTGPALTMLEQEIRVSHLYQAVKSAKGGCFRNEYTQGVEILS